MRTERRARHDDGKEIRREELMMAPRLVSPCFGSLSMGVTCVGLVVLVAQRCGSVTTTTALSLFAFVNSPCTIRTFPLSDSTPQRLPSAIAIFTFHITFFALAGCAAGYSAFGFGVSEISAGRVCTERRRLQLASHLASNTASTTATIASPSFPAVQHMSRNSTPR
jgi:hypothetical protein